MLLTPLVIVFVFLLAWSNGANDNFKGVATLYGSGVMRYRTALAIATVSTALGSAASLLVASALVDAFTGAELFDTNVVSVERVIPAACIGAALTIILATRLGMPTSTTHALVGALVGAALVAAPSAVDWNALLVKFARPLAVSPVLALAVSVLVSLVIAPRKRREREKRSMSDKTDGQHWSAALRPGLNFFHVSSAASVCFARAVNDTPKIAALLLAMRSTAPGLTITIVAAAMVGGGLLNARRVAQTMSKRITTLEPVDGLISNVTTATLVLIASRLGLPVSTTHVSCSAIAGVGLVNRTRQWATIGRIALTWITTLPCGLLLGAAASHILQATIG